MDRPRLTTDDIAQLAEGNSPENTNGMDCEEAITALAQELLAIRRASQAAPATPDAKWRKDGEPDPHGTRYDRDRASLAMGDLTDDELANAVFMYGNDTPDMREVIAGTAKMPIVYLTAAKDRIRWLSRQLAAQAAPAPSEPTGDRGVLAQVLRTRGKANSLHDIMRAADFLDAPAPSDGLREALTNLEKAASEVSRRGAQTGSQWSRLSVALLKARVALSAGEPKA